VEDVMLEFLPRELRNGLASAQMSRARKKSRMRVDLGGVTYPILRYWHNGMAIEADKALHLRGLVDVYDGAKHIFQCLIVASEFDGHELICEFKRATAVLDRAALDYVRDESAPVALIGKAR
jgi:hypothetical protein